ncbi:MAG TPA: extracellular solute-binding protein [Ktedonobacteraceae bacterium]|nr:extracellular solute-binding protein [Ktedonobacteraceae bacterium]
MDDLIQGTKQAYSRRYFVKVAAAATGGALLAACGGTQGSTQLTKAPTAANTLPQAQITATIQASVGKTYFPSGNPNVPDAFLAPLPPYQSVFNVPGRGGTVKVFTVGYHPPVPALSQNKYLQELNKRLNVNWQVTVAQDIDYAEKAGALLASGDLPDLFVYLSTPVESQALQQGAFTDLTSYLTGDSLKQFPNLARFPAHSWKNVAIQGKIYGVPRVRPIIKTGMQVRYDWMQTLGMANPQNADDFYKLMVAISKNHPSKRNAETWGIGQLYGPTAGLGNTGMAVSGVIGFILQMFRVPNMWRVESSGDVTAYIETPEYKDAIAYCNKLWNGGAVHPDGLSISTPQDKSNFLAGKTGSIFDDFGNSKVYRDKLKQVDSTADVMIMIPFGNNGGDGIFWFDPGYNGSTTIPSSSGSDAERVKELLRCLDYLAAPAFSIENNFIAYGIDGWDNTVGKNNIRVQTPTGQKETGDLVAYVGNGPSMIFDNIDPPYGLKIQNWEKNAFKIGVDNPTYGLNVPTPTQITKSATLQQIVDDRIIRIIKGQDPVSAVDDMVKLWLQSGGAQTKKEVAGLLHK